MRALSSADLLDLWERGWRLHPLDRGLLTLHAAFPEASYDSLADWPLGRRNRAMAELRRACVGPGLLGWVSCGQCGERLEFEMDSRKLLDTGLEPLESVSVRGRSFRLPTSRDLARAAREPDPEKAAIRVLESCCMEGAEDQEWSEIDLEEVGESMALADPLAETRLLMRCSQCGHQWDETLDLAAFFWSEIEASAKRLLLEVHTLASAYGWTESEILSLSEPRRARYLEMVLG
jgi:hypothetical protein